MKDKSYNVTKDTAGPPPVNSVSGIPELDPASLQTENRRLNAENKILCNIAIIRGNEAQRLKKQIEILEKERDDSYEKGFEAGSKKKN